MLVSGVANFNNSTAFAHGTNFINQDNLVASGAMQLKPLQQDVDGETTDECACKSNTNSSQFTCGVCLALASLYEVGFPATSVSVHVWSLNTNGIRQFPELEKKPPRTALFK